ncbi:MAG: hypothetical protein E8D46_02540 [Nitrospira sp.]|nr:MAG: hypothetical protein E8D46_02540 [Nitrospira sp.]
MGGKGFGDAHNVVRNDDAVEVSKPIMSGQWDHQRGVGGCHMKVDRQRFKNLFVVAGAAITLVAGMVSTVPSAYAGGTIKVDDDKYISIGMGTRMSFNSIEDGSASRSQWSNEFAINNARIYINGGIHKYVKFAFNTECFNCAVGQGNGSGAGAGAAGNIFASNTTIGLLDAIGQFEFTETVNFWIGRTLVPTERGELNGPFYHAVFDGFRTPFNQADFSGNIGAGGAGLYGRDNGAVFFGKVHPGGTHLQYVLSVFQGLRSGAGTPVVGPNERNSLKYAGRLTWNLLNDESNPGYYTSGTYYGTAGDILALAVGGEYQNAGAGSNLNKSAFGSFVGDVLFEKVLPNKGVFTANAEYKRYWAQNLAASGDAGCFCMFSGSSVTAYALYLFPNEIGIGRFQPYGRYTFVNSVHTSALDEFELGTNYVISGHNARISAFWRTGSLDPAGGPTTIGAIQGGRHQDSVHLALQLQY